MPPDYDALRKLRLDAPIMGLDRITAVTQNAVNRQLAYLFDNNKSFREFTHGHEDDDGSIDVEVGHPMIVFSTDGSNDATLILHFVGGWFTWDDREDEEDEEDIQKEEVDDYRIAIPTRVDSKQCRLQDIPRITNQIAACSLGSSTNYSVEQLFLDVSDCSAHDYISDESHLFESSSDSPKMVSFLGIVDQYMDEMRLSIDGERTGIAYIPKFTNTRSHHSPTILSTSREIILHPYRLTRGAAVLEGPEPDGGGNNMLLYAEMSQDRPMPRNPLRGAFQPYVVPGPGGVQIDGTVVLSRRAFLDDWLIPKLRQLNELTDIKATTPTVFHNPWYKPDALQYRWSRAVDRSRNYNFIYKGLQNNDSEVVWTFEHEETPPTGYASNTWLTLTSKVHNYVKVPVNTSGGHTCEVKIGGYTEATLTLKNMLTYIHVPGSMSWNASFKFCAVGVNGGLEVKMDPDIPRHPVVSSSAQTGIFGQFFNDDYGTHPEDAVKTSLEEFRVGPILTDLNKHFKGDYGFYFGAAGQYTLKNPVFDNHANLFCELSAKRSA